MPNRLIFNNFTMNVDDLFIPIEANLHIVLAEDDLIDRLLFKEALEELPVKAKLTTVFNGERAA